MSKETPNSPLGLLSHLVALECSYTLVQESKPETRYPAYFTGFLLVVKGYPVWVTAGHIMEAIEKTILADPKHYRDIKFRFVDTLHEGRKSQFPMPFDYLASKYRSYDFHKDENGVELGWDYGIIMPHIHYARLFSANQIAVIQEDNWTTLPEKFDWYYLLGIPKTTVRDEGGKRTVSPHLFPVTKLNEKPTQFAEQTDPMFYGIVTVSPEIGSIEGMSGGPIIGCKKMEDGLVRYWFLAIQSGWFESKRLICASPLHDLWNIITSAIEEGEKRRQGESTG
jgi:hypothetical protein